MNKTAIAVIGLAILIALFLFVKEGEKSTDRSTSVDSENFSRWQEFRPRSGLFKVMLPHPPQYAKDLVPIPGSDQSRRYDMYASEKIDGTLFLVSVITYPDEAETSQVSDILKETVNELLHAKPDNKLSKLEEGMFKTQKSLDFSFLNGDLQVEGKVFIVGKTVYVLSYATRKNEFDSTEFKHFIDSFELIEEPSTTATPNPKKEEAQ